MRKQDFCMCENNEADQLHGYCEADQRLCFCYIDSTITLLPKIGRCGGLVVERRTLEREVRGSILTQVAVLYL